MFLINNRDIYEKKSSNTHEGDSAILSIYQICNVYNWQDKLATSLFNSIINDKFFDQLRTKEQLGYIVQSKIKNIGYDECPFMIYNLVIQSPKKSSSYLKQRIESFISSFTKILYDIPDNEINKYINTTILNNSIPFNNITDDFMHYSNIIIKNHNIFNLRNIIVDELKKITKKNIIDYFNNYFINGNKIIILFDNQ